MKNFYILFLSLALFICSFNSASSQSVSVAETIFLPQDSISVSYSQSAFNSTDWIGIYKVGKVPGDGESVAWAYVNDVSGTIKLGAPAEAGKYKAYLCCCDGYDVIAVSAEFSIEIPSISTSFPVYSQRDSVEVSYYSPKFSPTDKVAIYYEWSTPGVDEPVSWKYITSSTGEMKFPDNLQADYYNAYLLCCDGTDIISSCNFEVRDSMEAFIMSKMLDYESGVSMEFIYNDPEFVAGDWIGIYSYYADFGAAPITWSQIISNSGTVTFPGVLPGGLYVSILKAAETGNIIATSEAFTVAENTEGTYIKTAAGVYPENFPIFVNYYDADFADKDWIGIYKKGDLPGGPESVLWKYAQNDSSTVEFAALPIGSYDLYLFCCDDYSVKAKNEFKVVGKSTPTLVASSYSFVVGESLEFTYNDPDFAGGNGTDWIGIYYAGDIPSDVRSLIWSYLPSGSGQMMYSTPYENGTYPEDYPDFPLQPGEYWAGMFCCDAYGVYASTYFVVTEVNTSADAELSAENNLRLYPNPTTGYFNVEVTTVDKPKKITAYSLSGQVVFEKNLDGSESKKSFDLSHLNKGVYFIEVLTQKNKLSKKLIIQ